jgi:hypothetical protein
MSCYYRHAPAGSETRPELGEVFLDSPGSFPAEGCSSCVSGAGREPRDQVLQGVRRYAPLDQQWRVECVHKQTFGVGEHLRGSPVAYPDGQ